MLQIQVDIQNSRSILDNLPETTIKQIYPRALQLLFHDLDEIHTLSNSNSSHLSSIQHLDQLYVTASRLYHDLNSLDSLKYIAYQLALLYVRVSNLVQVSIRMLKMR